MMEQGKQNTGKRRRKKELLDTRKVEYLKIYLSLTSSYLSALEQEKNSIIISD